MGMMDWVDILKVGLCSAMLTLTALGLGIAAIMPGANRWNKRFFIFLFATTMLLTATGLFDLLIYKNPGMAMEEKFCIFLEYLLIPLPMPLFTAYLLHTCGEGWQKSSLFRAVIVSLGFFILLLSAAQFTEALYYVTPENHFCRGPWHPLLMAAMVLPMLINSIGVLRRRSQLSPQYHAAFLIYLLSLSAAHIIHSFWYCPELVFTGLVLSALSMFGIILFDQIEQYMRQQRKIAQQRASIMVLQMRPHFIYNAMMSIYYLCAKDPKKAQHVTLDFTTYLRKNFTAIASEDAVPFADELEHTRAYLAVEQVQFEDSLAVRYDILHEDFRLPPLTLQPIVENAVKHGMDPEYAPLRITIRTRQTDSGSEISVEDNGPGFAPADNQEPHIALANIRERLQMQGGKLAILPRKEGGTIVKVIIPDRELPARQLAD